MSTYSARLMNYSTALQDVRDFLYLLSSEAYGLEV